MLLITIDGSSTFEIDNIDEDETKLISNNIEITLDLHVVEMLLFSFIENNNSWSGEDRLVKLIRENHKHLGAWNGPEIDPEGNTVEMVEVTE